MNNADTAHLVNLIISTWPLGVRGHVWTEALRPLDHDTAHAAYIRLRDEDDKPPSVARYRDMYRVIEHQQTEPEPTDDDGEERIGLEEYIRRLTKRAETSLDAHNELAIWQRNRHGLGKRL